MCTSVLSYNRAEAHGDKKMKKNETIIMEAKPNTLGTFEMLMLLGHTLHEKSGENYNVIVDFKSDSVKLVLVK